MKCSKNEKKNKARWDAIEWNATKESDATQYKRKD